MLVYSAYGTAACVARISGIPKPACVSGCVSRVTMTSTSVTTISPLLCLKRQVVHFSFYFLDFLDNPLNPFRKSDLHIETPAPLVVVDQQAVPIRDVTDIHNDETALLQSVATDKTKPSVRAFRQIDSFIKFFSVCCDAQRKRWLRDVDLLNILRKRLIFNNPRTRAVLDGFSNPYIRIRRARRGLIG